MATHQIYCTWDVFGVLFIIDNDEGSQTSAVNSQPWMNGCRSERSIETIPSFEQWSQTIENHWNQWWNNPKTTQSTKKHSGSICLNGLGGYPPLYFEWVQSDTRASASVTSNQSGKLLQECSCQFCFNFPSFLEVPLDALAQTGPRLGPLATTVPLNRSRGGRGTTTASSRAASWWRSTLRQSSSLSPGCTGLRITTG